MIKTEAGIPPPEATKGRPSKYRELIKEVMKSKDKSIRVTRPCELEGIRRCARDMGIQANYRHDRTGWIIWLSEREKKVA